MDRLTVFQGYNQYREAVGSALVAAEEDFVYIGYLLRRAKEDPVILAGSPYDSYTEFAKAEFGLEESMVSRFININEKYADGIELLPQYKGFGVSKLGEMLSLPGAVADQLTPDVTREEIREIKADIREEKQTTDVERYIDRMQLKEEDGSVLYRFFEDYFKDHKDAFTDCKGFEEDLDNKDLVSDALFPNGDGIIRAHIKGEGNAMIKSRGTDEDLTVTFFADNHRETITWDELMDGVYPVGEKSQHWFTEEGWQEIYGAKPKNAPAQESNEHLSTAPKTEEQPEPIAEEIPKPDNNVLDKSEIAQSSNDDERIDDGDTPIEEKNALKTHENASDVTENEKETHEEAFEEHIDDAAAVDPVPFPETEETETIEVEDSPETKARKCIEIIEEMLSNLKMGAETYESNWERIEESAAQIVDIAKKEAGA